MAETYWHLKSCVLFEQLTDERLRKLESACRARTFPRKSTIYLPADAADGVLLLASGRVKISGISSDGKQTILAFVEPGEIFGELALLASDAREEHAETVEKSLIVLIPADVLGQLMHEQADVSLGVTKLMGLRRRRIERRLKYLLFRSTRERLASLLLELAEQYGRETADGVELAIKLTHQELASIIGSTRESVTVVMGELQIERMVRLGRRKIVVTDLQKLAGIVDMPAPEAGKSRARTSPGPIPSNRFSI